MSLLKPFKLTVWSPKALQALSSAHSTKTPADSSARGRKRCCCLCKLFVYDVCDCTATLLVLLDELNVAEELLADESPARGRYSFSSLPK